MDFTCALLSILFASCGESVGGVVFEGEWVTARGNGWGLFLVCRLEPT